MSARVFKLEAFGRLRWAFRTKRHPRSLAGHLRLLWHDFVIHVLFEGGERCQDCGCDYVLWEADCDLYERVHGGPGGLLCPRCFSRQAREKGLRLIWRPELIPCGPLLWLS